LTGSLLESLEHKMDTAAEEEWSREIARRIEELDPGKVKPIHEQKCGGKSPPSSMATKQLEIHPSALAQLKSALSWYLELVSGRTAVASSSYAFSRLPSSIGRNKRRSRCLQSLTGTDGPDPGRIRL